MGRGAVHMLSLMFRVSAATVLVALSMGVVGLAWLVSRTVRVLIRLL